VFGAETKTHCIKNKLNSGIWVFAGMTPSIGFSDRPITDGSQSPSCNICVVNYRLNVYVISVVGIFF